MGGNGTGYSHPGEASCFSEGSSLCSLSVVPAPTRFSASLGEATPEVGAHFALSSHSRSRFDPQNTSRDGESQLGESWLDVRYMLETEDSKCTVLRFVRRILGRHHSVSSEGQIFGKIGFAQDILVGTSSASMGSIAARCKSQKQPEKSTGTCSTSTSTTCSASTSTTQEESRQRAWTTQGTESATLGPTAHRHRLLWIGQMLHRHPGRICRFLQELQRPAAINLCPLPSRS